MRQAGISRAAILAFALAIPLASISFSGSTARADVSSTAPTPPPTPHGDDEPSAVGFSFGIRAGYSIPVGIANDTGIRNVVSGAVPIGVDAGYFISPHLYVGVYGLYGFGIISQSANSTCYDPANADVSCSASLIRFGAIARWHFRPLTGYDPWVGAGIGYDIVNLTLTDETDGSTSESSALHGFELLNLQGGLDFKPKAFYGLGPYVEVSTGHYASDSSATSLHAWITLGVRLRTGL